jgi:hypothetical protein
LPFDPGSDAVLRLRHEGGSSSIVIVNNLSAKKQAITLPLSAEDRATCTELLADAPYPDAGKGELTLNSFGFRWLRVRANC